MTFVAQNKGAKNSKRMKEGFKKGICIEFLYWIIICIVVLVFKESIMGLFVSKNDFNMMNMGAGYLKLMAFFYVMPAFTNGIQGFFRGIGDMKVTLVCTFIQISIRTLFVYLLVKDMGLNGTAYACVVGWAMMLIYQGFYYFRYEKKSRELETMN